MLMIGINSRTTIKEVMSRTTTKVEGGAMIRTTTKAEEDGAMTKKTIKAEEDGAMNRKPPALAGERRGHPKPAVGATMAPSPRDNQTSHPQYQRFDLSSNHTGATGQHDQMTRESHGRSHETPTSTLHHLQLQYQRAKPRASAMEYKPEEAPIMRTSFIDRNTSTQCSNPTPSSHSSTAANPLWRRSSAGRSTRATSKKLRTRWSSRS